MHTASKLLGDEGEDLAVELLNERGFIAEKLPVNYPSYDLQVVTHQAKFQVSVKVSRERQHVRLGARRSVDAYTRGNFVFAFVPQKGGKIASLKASPSELLIIPAEVARAESLVIHDEYWKERGKDPNAFSIIVKEYSRYGRPTWERWQQYRSAWHLLQTSEA